MAGKKNKKRSKNCTPLGYYLGTSEVAIPGQEQMQMAAMARPQMMSAPLAAPQPTVEEQVGQQMMAAGINKGVDVAAEKAMSSFAKEAATEAGKNVAAEAGKTAATEGSKALLEGASGAALGGIGSLAIDAATGDLDDKSLMKAGLTAAGTAIGGPVGALAAQGIGAAMGLKDGTAKVPPMDTPNYKPQSSGAVADVNFSKRVEEANKKAQEEFLKKLKEAMKEQ